MRQEQIQQCLTLVFCDISLVALRKGEQALVPNDRQFGLGISLSRQTRHSIARVNRGGVDASEAQEVEHQGVDDLVGERILLLKESLDEDVGSTTALGAV